MKVKFNENQLDRLSEYLANFSLLIFGTVVVPQLVGGINLSVASFVLGLIATALFLIISLILL